MGTEKKRRKRQDTEEHSEAIYGTESKGDTDDHMERKVKRRKSDEKSPRAKKVKKAPNSTEEDSSPLSKSVHLDSLQSIFETKTQEDTAFTLFGGDTVSETLPEPPSHIHPQRFPVPPESVKVQQKTLNFFPHYESREKNAQSLLSELEEPFYYDRTEYAFFCFWLIGSDEKRRLWDEGKYELTQDWKKKWKAAQKLKRRVEIRRRL
jgi:hypothetical protein